MGKALYRAYRPKRLADIVGQEHIASALARALEKGAISHAYLFTGPRGTGKTSIARILAHQINNLPYEDESYHLDIIEIDAASNRRIDEIRDLRDKVHTAPTSAKYKVYIIDEVHMLTREAFNALLKTLEEPPAHAVFILATTEAHKLPETIISRTQRFGFKPVEQGKVVAHLKSIAKQEGIDIADDALELVAAHGEGSFRDSISLLDQVRHTGQKVTLADVQAALGIAPAELINDIIASLASHDAAQVSACLQTLHEQGFEPSHTARQLGSALRSALMQDQSPLAPQTTLKLLAALVEVPASSDPKAYLEIALLDTALADASQPPAAAPKSGDKPKQSKTASEPVQAKPDVQVEPHPSSFHKAHKAEPAPQEKPAPAKPATVKKSQATLDDQSWQLALGTIKQKYNTLYSILNMAAVSFAPGEVTITTSNKFYKKRLDEARNKEVICDTIQGVTGQKIEVRCEQDEVPEKTAAKQAPPLPPADGETVHTVQAKPAKNDMVDTISNIFGGAEVLES
jgi:DNA polymerase-3 subunit gamma/tau